MMKRMVIVTLFGMASMADAYTPTNWLPEHAASDFQQTEAIIVARVVGLNRISSTNAVDPTVQFHATFIVGRQVHGPLATGQRFSFLIGEEPVGSPVEEDCPRYGLLLHGTQQSYWLEVNGVYLLSLSRTEQGWEPRSGPLSVFRIQTQTPSHDKTLLVIDPRGNRTEAQENVLREMKQAPRVLLEDFLREKMTMTPNEASQTVGVSASQSEH
jgi:hypothetical protein